MNLIKVNQHASFLLMTLLLLALLQIRTSLIDIIRNNPNDGEYALDLLMIAKYCERIGDHCTNIAEWVEFSVTGVHKDCQ